MARSACALLLLAVLLGSEARAADRSFEPIVSRIPRHAVESRALAAVGYSKRWHALDIEFRRGGTYRYFAVPPSVCRDLLASDSKAKFYNTNIRGKYRSVRVRRIAHPAVGR